ncbi:hypothetical protein [Peribacillus glennii]|uniref:hypothetical protein n=1 Tax=Peribacillus glennii TaxID=2303991 RepID=UPI00131471B2|nr:hypothetical protein [Peribacillus glennii]
MSFWNLDWEKNRDCGCEDDCKCDCGKNEDCGCNDDCECQCEDDWFSNEDFFKQFFERF